MFWLKKRLQYNIDHTLQLDTPLRKMSFTVFDTETTGFSVGTKDRVIEIGAVQVKNMKVTDQTFQTFVNPLREIPTHITELTSIEQHHVDGAPLAFEAIGEYFRFMESNNSHGWVAHCLSFDAMAIRKELNREKYTFEQPLSFDTQDMINFLFPTWDIRDIEEYADIFGTKVFTRHRALGDALTTAHIFVELLKLLEEQGVTTLAHLNRLSNRKAQVIQF